MSTPTLIDSFRGDHTGLTVPAHVDALHTAGASFLTEAFRAFGAIAPDNAVTQIVSLEHCPGDGPRSLRSPALTSRCLCPSHAGVRVAATRAP